MKRRGIIKKKGDKPKVSKYEQKEIDRKKGILYDNSPLPDGVKVEYRVINGIQVKTKVVEQEGKVNNG